ncbi:MAG: hypothetical protein JW757_10665 [Anaerolineales bacterium]|nr:hypothetical protein [Anaerolineales bacterium]
MAGLTAVVLITISMVLQNSIVVRLQMLEGAADLVLLVLVSWVMVSEHKQHWQFGLLAGLLVGLSSAIPWWIPALTYAGFTLGITLVQRRIWQVPIWLLLTATFFGTILILGVEIFYLWVTGVPLDLVEVFNVVILPSVVLNMIAVLPVYGLVGEIAKRSFPREVEV